MSGRRRAVIVANDLYEHAGLRQLRAPAADASALSRVLGDQDIGGFEVEVVLNEPAHAVAARVDDLFSEAASDDLILLHFSCHGLKNEAGELFFAARNTRPDRLGSTAVAADFVQRCMRSSRARRIVLFLDCCYGGAFGQGVTVRGSGSANVLDSFPLGKLGGGRGRAVFSASSAMEYAFEGERLSDDRQQPSAFTSALVEGLDTGEADRDQDGLVSLNELYDYIFDKVREHNPNQTPTRDVEMQGDLYLARSPHRRIRPAAIPAEVREALQNPNMFTRLGAVSELRARLRAQDVAVALGAHIALTELSRNDIKYVEDGAAEALGSVVLHVLETEVSFGAVPQGSAPQPVTLHAQGPPLARLATADVSAPWIRTRPVPEGFQVTIDTSREGTLRGSCTLTGPTGRQVVPVSADVVAESRPEVPASQTPAALPEAMPAARTAAADHRSGLAARSARSSRAPAPESVGAEASTVSVGASSAPSSRDRALSCAGWLCLAAGVLVLASLFLPFRYDDLAAHKVPDLTWFSVLLGGLAVAAGAALAVAAPQGRWLGPGLVVSAGATAVWGLADLLGVARAADGDGFQVGYGSAVLGDLMLFAAGAIAGARLAARLGSLARLPSRHNRLEWLIILLGVGGAVIMVGTAVEVWTWAADGGYPWYGAQAAYLAVLAIAVPFCAVVLRPPVVGFSLLSGWFLGGVGLVCHYWVILDSSEASRKPLLLFAMTLPVLMILGAVRAFGAEPQAQAARTPAF